VKNLVKKSQEKSLPYVKNVPTYRYLCSKRRKSSVILKHAKKCDFGPFCDLNNLYLCLKINEEL